MTEIDCDSSPPSNPGLAEEARAFDARIRERRAAGFVPDIRGAVRCDHFYKSFWRDPHFVRLHMGTKANLFLDMLARHGDAVSHRSGRQSLRILDVGCGPGHISLELARAGHHVLAIDISAASIEAARETLAANTFVDGFGSLEYRNIAFEQATGLYDAVVFSGAIHHFADCEAVVARATELLHPHGLLLCGEPCHEEWRLEDAAQVALMRQLLALTGHWYEPAPMGGQSINGEMLRSYIQRVYTEYVTERDRHEAGGQSPGDNASTGAEIRAALGRHFVEMEYIPGESFTYRQLGGLRGPDEVVHPIADFLAVYDRTCVEMGILKPNGFYYAGRKMESAA